MLFWSFKINKNYAFEIASLYKIRSYKDGIIFGEINIGLDLYKGDHNPQFRIDIILLNFMIIDLRIYNVNHMKE